MILRLQKWLLALFLLVGVPPSLCADQALRPKVDGKTVLRLPEFPKPGQPGRAEVDLFLARNPDIVLQQSQGIAIEGMSQSQLLLAMAAGTGPDVFYGSLSDVESYHAQRFVAPLTGLYKRDRDELLPIMDSVKPILYQDGELIAIPQFYKVMALGNRRDLLTRYVGVNGDEAPTDWDEWFQWCLKLTHPDEGIHGLALYGGSWIFEIYLRLAGGEMVEAYKVDPVSGKPVAPLAETGPHGEPLFPGTNAETGADLAGEPVRWRVAIDQPPAIRALNFHKRLLWVEWIRAQDSGRELVFVDYPDYETGKPVVHHEVKDPVTGRLYRLTRGSRPRNDIVTDDQGKPMPVHVGVARAYLAGDTGYLNDFLTGRIAMMPIAGGRDAVFDERFSPDLVGLTVFPPGPAPWGRLSTELNAGCYCLNSQIEDPDVRDAAWRWIKFLSGRDRQALKVRQWVEDGLAAYVLPEWLEKFGYEEYLHEVPQAWIRQNRELEKVARPVAGSPGLRAAGAQIAGTLDRIYLDPGLDAATELHQKAIYINRYLMDEDNTEFLRKARPYAYGIAALAALLIGLLVRSLWRNLRQQAGGAKAVSTIAGKKRNFALHLIAWSMMLPALALVVLFEYYPLLQGSVMAFQDYHLLGARPFVGLDNFIGVITSASFWHSIKVTLYFVALSLTIGFFAPVLLALLLSEIPRLQYFFRTIYFLPAVTSGFIIMILWKQFFDPTPSGLLNQVFATIGLGPYKWLQDPSLALMCTIIPGVWAGAGPGCLLYLAALKTVSGDLYEAADIDGAGWWAKVRNVSIPTILPLMIINFIGAFIGAFHGMGNILVMTGGGPDRATQVIGLEIWMNAFVYLRYGYATAMAWILAAALIGFVVLQMRLLKRMEFRASGTS